MAARDTLRNNGRTVGMTFPVRSVSRLYNEGQLPLPGLPGGHLGLFATGTCIYDRTAKRVVFSESCSESP
jgi:hypothetical protein